MAMAIKEGMATRTIRTAMARATMIQTTTRSTVMGTTTEGKHFDTLRLPLASLLTMEQRQLLSPGRRLL